MTPSCSSMSSRFFRNCSDDVSRAEAEGGREQNLLHVPILVTGELGVRGNERAVPSPPPADSRVDCCACAAHSRAPVCRDADAAYAESLRTLPIAKVATGRVVSCASPLDPITPDTTSRICWSSTLLGWGHEVLDLGTDDAIESVDYPDFGAAVGPGRRLGQGRPRRRGLRLGHRDLDRGEQGARRARGARARRDLRAPRARAQPRERPVPGRAPASAPPVAVDALEAWLKRHARRRAPRRAHREAARARRAPQRLTRKGTSHRGLFTL